MGWRGKEQPTSTFRNFPEASKQGKTNVSEEGKHPNNSGQAMY